LENHRPFFNQSRNRHSLLVLGNVEWYGVTIFSFNYIFLVYTMEYKLFLMCFAIFFKYFLFVFYTW